MTLLVQLDAKVEELCRVHRRVRILLSLNQDAQVGDSPCQRRVHFCKLQDSLLQVCELCRLPLIPVVESGHSIGRQDVGPCRVSVLARLTICELALLTLTESFIAATVANRGSLGVTHRKFEVLERLCVLVIEVVAREHISSLLLEIVLLSYLGTLRELVNLDVLQIFA